MSIIRQNNCWNKTFCIYFVIRCDNKRLLCTGSVNIFLWFKLHEQRWWTDGVYERQISWRDLDTRTHCDCCLDIYIFLIFTFKMESKQSVRYCYKTVCSIRSWTATHCVLLWLHTIIALDDSQPTCQPDFGGIFSESRGTVRQVYTVSLQCTHTARLWKLYDL